MGAWQQVAAGGWHRCAAAMPGLGRAAPSLAKDEKCTAQAFPETGFAAGRAGLNLRLRLRLRLLLLLAACVLAVPATAADALRGSDLYRSHCAHCHGPSGKPVLPGAPDFKQPTALLKPDTALLALIREGRGAMPGYAGLLRDREILDLVSHLRTLR